jgi:hypothetical protein
MSRLYLNNPNWLGSEVGIVLKTITLDTTFATYETENGRKVVKSGTYVNDSVIGKGLLWNDIDITEEKQEASLMIRGSYVDANLPATVTAEATNLAARGLYAFAEGTTTRPSFGSPDLTALDTVTVTVAADDLTWTSNTDAIAYEVSDVNESVIATTTATGYTVATVATYNVRVLADNIHYTHSDYVTATVTTLA